MSKCKVKSDSIERSLRVLKNVIKGSSALPILESAVLWKEHNGSFCIGATDLETTCYIEIKDAKFSGKGNMASCVNIKTFLDVVKEICTTDMDISVDKNCENTKIQTSDNDIFELNSDPANQFPMLIMPSYTKSFDPPTENKYRDDDHYLFSIDLDKVVIDDVIKRVVPACAKTLLRPILTGIYVDMDEGRLTFAGTDSYRLSELSFEDGNGYKMIDGQFHNMIIPANAMEIVSSVLHNFNTDESAKIIMTSEVKVSRYADDYKSCDMEAKAGDIQSEVTHLTMISIETDSIKAIVSTRCIDGHYPDYKTIIPKKNLSSSEVEFSIDRNILHRIVKSAHVFSKDCNNNMVMEFHKDKEFMEIITPETGKGKFSKKVKDINYTKKNDNKIALSTIYMMDAIKLMDGSDMKFRITDSTHPAILNMNERDIGEFMHLIMPLRIQDDV